MQNIPRIIALLPLLTACAHAPAELSIAKTRVDGGMTYIPYNSWVKPGDVPEDQGNCAAFAVAYWAELRKLGVKADLPVACTLPSGQRHAALIVGDWVLDNRYNMVVNLNDYDCKPI